MKRIPIILALLMPWIMRHEKEIQYSGIPYAAFPSEATATSCTGNDRYDGTSSLHGATSSLPAVADRRDTSTFRLQDKNYYAFTSTIPDHKETDTKDILIPVNDRISSKDTSSYKISLSPGAKFWKGDTVFYQYLPVTGGKIAEAMIDEQGADPLNGVDVPTPKTHYWTGFRSQMDFPNDFIIDLGGIYKITSIFLYANKNYGYLDIIPGQAPYHFYDTITLRPLGTGWDQFKDTFYTRFIKVRWNAKKGGNQQINEMILYGHLAGKDSLSRVDPHAHPLPGKTSFTMGKFMGFNQIGPREVDSAGSLMRHYMQQDWMDTVTTTHNIDSIRFVFTKFGHYTDNTAVTASPMNYFFPGGAGEAPVKKGSYLTADDLHRMALDTAGYFDATQGVPVYAKKARLGKPIDIVNHPDADATKPLDYDRLARMMWNYAAYFGARRHHPDSLQTPYPELSGLGLRAYVEQGNEMNQNWAGRKNYYTPEEYIAYASAYYDGNLGKMGSRMGVKNADPTIKVVKAGTAGAHPERLKMIHFYTYYNRDDHSPPFDILNIHAYPSDGTNGRGTNKNAISPEEYFGNPDNPVSKYVKEANTAFPGMPVWLTEWGYDRNRATKIAVPYIEDVDSAKIQAQWIARFWFMLSFSGIQKSTMYQLRSEREDSLGTTTFNTTGLTKGLYVGDKHSPGIYASDWYAFPAYYFQRTIWLTLYHYKPDSIIYNNYDSIYVYRYRNENHPDSVAYAIWSGTMSNRITSDYAVMTGHPDIRARIINLADKKFTGDIQAVTTGRKGEIPLTISETPQILFTTEGTGGGILVKDTSPALSGKATLYFLGNEGNKKKEER